MKKILTIFLLWALLPTIFIDNVFAQNPVITKPYGITTNNVSSTIAVTNTFQSVFAASSVSTGRTACTIQNNGSNAMYVYFGPIANATINTSVKLAAGQNVTCNMAGGLVLKDQVSITGTAADVFYAAYQ